MDEYRNPDGTIDWARFESESFFARAAATKKEELMSQGVKESDIMLERIDGIEDLRETWDKLSELDNVEGLDVFSHGTSAGGPEIAGGSGDFWRNNPGQLNWGNNAYAVFHGCHTSGVAEVFANQQGVDTYGQSGGASFSITPGIHTPLWGDPFGWAGVWLFDWEAWGLVNTNGWGVEYSPEG